MKSISTSRRALRSRLISRSRMHGERRGQRGWPIPMPNALKRHVLTDPRLPQIALSEMTGGDLRAWQKQVFYQLSD